MELLRQHGFALGGSLENAVVVGETGVLNSALRFDDEFVRHKILDVIGDLALLGAPLLGHLVAHRGGHALHTAFAAKMLEERGAWELVEAAGGAPGAVPLGAAIRRRSPASPARTRRGAESAAASAVPPALHAALRLRRLFASFCM